MTAQISDLLVMLPKTELVVIATFWALASSLIFLAVERVYYFNLHVSEGKDALTTGLALGYRRQLLLGRHELSTKLDFQLIYLLALRDASQQFIYRTILASSIAQMFDTSISTRTSIGKTEEKKTSNITYPEDITVMLIFNE